jgi:hypothetical protein
MVAKVSNLKGGQRIEGQLSLAAYQDQFAARRSC